VVPGIWSGFNAVKERSQTLTLKLRKEDVMNGIRPTIPAIICAGLILAPAGFSAPGAGIVMTYNINEGTDFLQVQDTTTLQQFLIGVGQILTQVQGTSPPERMQAIARQILFAQPELVSLQEVDQWYSGTFDPGSGTCGPMTLQYDMLQELLGALAVHGAHYKVAVQVTQYAFPPTPGLIPPATFFCVAVNDYNVILARTDLPSSVFQWNNPQSGQFVNEVSLPTPVGPFPLPRSWASVDAQFLGHPFRYINTHLESFVASIREAQGAELRAGPANTSLPVILAMDSNAQAFPLPQDAAYLDFISAGYSDVWSRLFPALPGLTCCQDEADNNPVSQLSQRIDLILTLGKVTPLAAAVIGAEPQSRLPDGLWPSDHAAVAAALIVDGN
jgi:endonuclease/exonuclease/phosphatase family metal-dependent hydrolase